MTLMTGLTSPVYPSEWITFDLNNSRPLSSSFAFAAFWISAESGSITNGSAAVNGVRSLRLQVPLALPSGRYMIRATSPGYVCTGWLDVGQSSGDLFNSTVTETSQLVITLRAASGSSNPTLMSWYMAVQSNWSIAQQQLSFLPTATQQSLLLYLRETGLGNVTAAMTDMFQLWSASQVASPRITHHHLWTLQLQRQTAARTTRTLITPSHLAVSE